MLVVDDDQVNMLRFFLEEGGCKAKSAGSAIDLLKAEPGEFNLVVTDNLMADMDGGELCRYVKGDYLDIKVIITTGGTVPDAGDDSILKPFTRQYFLPPLDKVHNFR